jgi:hypothetical protein
MTDNTNAMYNDDLVSVFMTSPWRAHTSSGAPAARYAAAA